MNCIKCGSFAINENSYDRVRGVDSDLCDVHYWMKRATRITELEAQLADAKQAASWESDVASQAIADLEPYRKDAQRWQAVKPMFRTMSANIDGNHTWTLAYHGLLKGASMDDAADKVIQAEVKAILIT